MCKHCCFPLLFNDVYQQNRYRCIVLFCIVHFGKKVAGSNPEDRPVSLHGCLANVIGRKAEDAAVIGQ